LRYGCGSDAPTGGSWNACDTLPILQPLADARTSQPAAPLPPALAAALFDMGGTLDGDGLHWLDRFAAAYHQAGIAVPFERLRAAFDEAERRAAVDEEMAGAGLRAMLQRHVFWQLACLELPDERLATRIVDLFEQPVRKLALRHAVLLNSLKERGLHVGVVSNGCGNVEALCRDLGYAPSLSVVIDSRRAGVAKPDPRIYAIAAESLALPPMAIMMIGDSFERDIVPAKALGMQTAWLHGGRVCPDDTRVDVMLESIAQLPAVLDRRRRAER
jgi:putative hydrolase of the HAD superfamily